TLTGSTGASKASNEKPALLLWLCTIIVVVITISAVANKPPSFAHNALKVDVSLEDAVLAVKKKIVAKIPKFHPSHQKLVLPSDKKKVLAGEITARELGLSAGGELEIKDSGSQAGWRTVYVVECECPPLYSCFLVLITLLKMGPLIIHAIVYNFPELFYGKPVEHSTLQKFCCIMITLHFVKHVLKSLFVHHFSHRTMPFFNIFKNSAHYRILSGILLTYDLYRPAFSALSPSIKGTPHADNQYLFVFILFWTLFKLGNLNAHLILRSLQPAGTKKLSISYGFGFGLISSLHYYFEAMGWITISLMTRSYPGMSLFLPSVFGLRVLTQRTHAVYLFTIVGTAQMLVWALKRHRQYKKEFGKEYPRNRKAMFPFLMLM
ncbi:synaptic glycoprotein sc2, partial [Moniliophthora roreri]